MLLLFAFIVFIAVRLVLWLSTWTHPVVRVLAVVVYAALTFSVFLLIYSFSGTWAEIGRSIGAYWLGIFLYLSLSVVLVNVIMLIVRLITRPDKEKWKKARFACGWVVICLTACVSIYGFWHADNPLVTSYTYDVEANHAEKVNQSPKESDALRIVLVGDLHLGAEATEARLPRVIDLINAQDPDIVLIAGDLFNNNFATIDSPETIISEFSRIDAPLGAVACLGNHDCGYGFDEMLTVLEQGNVTVLREDYLDMDGRFIVIGRQDGSAINSTDGLRRGSLDSIMERVGDTDLPIFVLDHNPSHINEYGDGFAMVLCGHTHDGQVFPLTLLTASMYATDYGLYQRDLQSPVLLVTSGVGYWGPPMRVGSDSEIAVIDVRS